MTFSKPDKTAPKVGIGSARDEIQADQHGRFGHFGHRRFDQRTTAATRTSVDPGAAPAPVSRRQRREQADRAAAHRFGIRVPRRPGGPGSGGLRPRTDGGSWRELVLGLFRPVRHRRHRRCTGEYWRAGCVELQRSMASNWVVSFSRTVCGQLEWLAAIFATVEGERLTVGVGAVAAPSPPDPGQGDLVAIVARTTAEVFIGEHPRRGYDVHHRNGGGHPSRRRYDASWPAAPAATAPTPAATTRTANQRPRRRRRRPADVTRPLKRPAGRRRRCLAGRFHPNSAGCRYPGGPARSPGNLGDQEAQAIARPAS